MEEKKSFIQEHKKTFMVIGGVAVGLVATRFVYRLGRYSGGVQGFFEAIKWCDETFPDIKLQELYDAWIAAHPEKVVQVIV